MTTYLLTWNPSKWHWPPRDFNALLEAISAKGFAAGQWSCGNTKKIREGDRVFLLRQGSEERGLIASGWVTEEPYADRHWGASSPLAPEAMYVRLAWDWLSTQPVISRERLGEPPFVGVNWDTQRSGITVDGEIAVALEYEWSQQIGSYFQLSADEVLEDRYWEGAVRRVAVNAFERSASARARCIAHHGSRCHICGLDFAVTYGAAGIGMIHVHHLVPLSSINRSYTIDPITDLVPVCPNCHAIVHRRQPPYAPSEVKEMLRKVPHPANGER
jgi:5-methylcytosine-specific restriction enzyme A